MTAQDHPALLIGSDEAGYELKETIKRHLMDDLGMAVLDVGCHDTQAVDYPDVAEDLAGRIATGDHQRGILICGTGIGMAIAANKVPGVRAAQCHDTYSAERARKSNNAQVLTMGARVIGSELAKQIVDSWLNSEFAGGASARKVAKIDGIEEKYTHDR